jgi:hypothetical protein
MTKGYRRWLWRFDSHLLTCWFYKEKKMAAIKKIKKMMAAVLVSIAAFFELCFTGRADCAWRMARSEKALSSPAGPQVIPAEYPRARPGNYILRSGAGVPPPAPAPQLSRKVGIGMYGAMLIFLAFFIILFVSCPDGQAFHGEDVTSGIRSQSASGTGTEAPSSLISTSDKIKGSGCVLFSWSALGFMFFRAHRKESRYGKEGSGGQD